jgi:hypothetical protein
MRPVDVTADGLVGCGVFGRRGYLATVATEQGGDDGNDGNDGAVILVRGGVSDALVFHLPASRVRSVSPTQRTVTIDADVGDFVPRLGDRGTVELHLVR